MISVLAALGSGSTLALIALAAWLTYRLVRAKDDVIAASDAFHKTHEELTDERHAHNDEIVAHETTKVELEQERRLRTIMEQQLNEAERKVREELRGSWAHLTNEEFNDAVKDLFSAPLGVVRVPDSMPSVPGHSAASNDLERP